MTTPEPTAREMVADLARALQARRRRDAYRACDRIMDAMHDSGVPAPVTLPAMPKRLTR